MSIRVAIVEDQTAVREGLVSMLAEMDTNFICRGFPDGESFLSGFEDYLPQVALMDVGLPGMSGIDVSRTVQGKYPDTQIIMLTVFFDDQRIFQSLQAGAIGYVLKSSPPGQIVDAINAVMRGESPMSGAIARRVIQSFHRTTPRLERIDSLTERETQILEQLVAGFRYKQISDALDISIDTVRTHVRHIYRKLQVRSRGEATAAVLLERNR